jgi:hypothetical protein
MSQAGSNSSSGGGGGKSFPWLDEDEDFNALAFHGYFVTATATATLPASAAQGDPIEFAVDSEEGILTIQANTGQFIRIGTDISMSNGTCASNFDGDSIRLIFRLVDTTWICVGAPEGTWNIT